MASSTVSAGVRGTAAPRRGSLKARRPVGASARRRKIGPDSPVAAESAPGASRVPVSTTSTHPSGVGEGPGSVSTTPKPSTVAKSVPSVARCQVMSVPSCQMGTTPLKGTPKRMCSGAACRPRAGVAACRPRTGVAACFGVLPVGGSSGPVSSCFPRKYSLMVAAYGASARPAPVRASVSRSRGSPSRGRSTPRSSDRRSHRPRPSARRRGSWRPRAGGRACRPSAGG